MTLDCVCDPLEYDGEHFIQWYGTYFGTCVYTTRDVIAFYFGLANICLWIFAQAPQLWETYQNKRSDSLSMSFLLQWLFGDIANLIGCLLTHQLPVQTYTGYYFMLMDVLLVGQTAWYSDTCKKRREEKRGRTLSIQSQKRAQARDPLLPYSQGDRNQGSSGERFYSFFPLLMGAFLLFGGASSGYLPGLSTANAPSPASRHILSVEKPSPSSIWSDDLYSFDGSVSINHVNAWASLAPLNQNQTQATFGNSSAANCQPTIGLSPSLVTVGDVMAWISGVLYFGARIPQIVLNHKRKSTEGLSIILFLFALLANIFYTISILLPNETEINEAFWESTAAYILGSGMTTFTSGIIVIQFWWYKGNTEAQDGNNSGVTDNRRDATGRIAGDL